MSLYVNRTRYKGGSPTLGASSGIINNAVLNGHDFYDDDYNPTPPAHDYSQDYLTIESLENENTIRFVKGSSAPSNTYYYSLDNGTTWASSSSTGSWVLNSGAKIIFKSVSNAFSRNNSVSYRWEFKSSSSCIVYGNIMSLLYGDDFIGKTTLKGNWSFNGLFYANGPRWTDISNLILPATTLTDNCYNNMFLGSSSTTAPILPATTLTSGCYTNMFYGCSSLNQVTCLATDISASNCLSNWLYGVSANGTFIKNSSMLDWSSGASGIPTGWTVQDYAA